MRQRTMAPTPEDYESADQSVGIPTTIEVPLDALSDDDEEEEAPQIPLKIEVCKVRAPSRRYAARTIHVEVEAEEEEEAEDIHSSGESTTTSMQYDEYLYGSRVRPPRAIKLKSAKEEVKDLEVHKRSLEEHKKAVELKVQVEKERVASPPSSTAPSKTSTEKEAAALGALGRSLVNHARRATHTAHKREGVPLMEFEVDTQEVEQEQCPAPSNRISTRRPSLARSISVPSMKLISAREAVDSFHTRSRTNRVPVYTPSKHRREIDLSKLQEEAESMHSREQSPPPPPAAHHPANSALSAQPSLSMIFAPSKQLTATLASPAAKHKKEPSASARTIHTHSTHTHMTAVAATTNKSKKEPSARTIHTHSTHTHMTSSSHYSPHHYFYHNQSPSSSIHLDRSNSHNHSQTDLGASFNDSRLSQSSLQDHSAYVGYIVDYHEGYHQNHPVLENNESLLQQEESIAATPAPRRNSKVTKPHKKPMRHAPPIPMELPPKTSTTTATTCGLSNSFSSRLNYDSTATSCDYPEEDEQEDWPQPHAQYGNTDNHKQQRKKKGRGWTLFHRRSMTALKR